MSPDRINEILERLPYLPDTAVVPVAVAARHDNISERTVRRTYPLVQLSPARSGVRVKFLRDRGIKSAAA
jgi:hypothetical protein